MAGIQMRHLGVGGGVAGIALFLWQFGALWLPRCAAGSSPMLLFASLAVFTLSVFFFGAWAGRRPPGPRGPRVADESPKRQPEKP